MQSKSKYNKGFPFLLCVIDIFSKYAWIVKTKRFLQLLILFKKVLDESNYKPNKTWVDKAVNFTIDR